MINRTDSNLLNLRGIPVFRDLDSMSFITGFSKQMLFYYAVKYNTNKYKIFEINKKNNTKRKIFEPKFALKMLQRWILENILYKVKCSDYAFAFIKSNKNPLKKNASVHADKVFILKMDFENFFPSISRKQIVELFNSLGYNISVSNWLANACTYDNILPQGSVTAPYLSNLICVKLDSRIAKYCSRRDITYSRYADDLTFSGDNKVVLKSIYPMIKKISESELFKLNDNKTRFIGKKSKKTVTGVIIHNSELKAPKEYKRLVRAMIHRAIISGDYSKNEVIKGYIAYINSIEDGYKQKIIDYINAFNKKDIRFIKSAVDLFNDNKLYDNILDLNEVYPKTINEFEYVNDILAERNIFLEGRGLNNSILKDTTKI